MLVHIKKKYRIHGNPLVERECLPSQHLLTFRLLLESVSHFNCLVSNSTRLNAILGQRSGIGDGVALPLVGLPFAEVTFP